MKLTIEVESPGPLLSQLVTEYYRSTLPSVVLQRILDGVEGIPAVPATMPEDVRIKGRFIADLRRMIGEYQALERRVYNAPEVK